MAAVGLDAKTTSNVSASPQKFTRDSLIQLSDNAMQLPCPLLDDWVPSNSDCPSVCKNCFVTPGRLPSPSCWRSRDVNKHFRKRGQRGGLKIRERKSRFPRLLPNDIQTDELRSIDTIISQHVTPERNHKPSIRSVNVSNLIKIQPEKNTICTAKTSDSLVIATFNAQSLGPSCQDKRLAIYDFILENEIDIFLIQESWFKSKGDEGKCAEMTPPGFMCKSYPRSNRGGGLAVIFFSGAHYRNI